MWTFGMFFVYLSHNHRGETATARANFLANLSTDGQRQSGSFLRRFFDATSAKTRPPLPLPTDRQTRPTTEKASITTSWSLTRGHSDLSKNADAAPGCDGPLAHPQTGRCLDSPLTRSLLQPPTHPPTQPSVSVTRAAAVRPGWRAGLMTGRRPRGWQHGGVRPRPPLPHPRQPSHSPLLFHTPASRHPAARCAAPQ